MPSSTFSPNPKQKEAIEHVSGPMLVLAGAGTGKTTVLVERIARLIEQGHAQADEILAITFTENAAAELKERVEKRLKRKAPIFAGTFNAYCYSILQRNGKGFYTLVPEDVYVFLRQRVKHLELERFIKASDLGQFLKDLRAFFDRCHEELVSPQEFQAFVDSLPAGAGVPRNCKAKDVDDLGHAEILLRWREIARAYTHSMRLLENDGLGTFGMQISKAVRLLQADAELLEAERKKARFILIDEFQDCNSSNITLAELLAGEEKNVFVVGDPDQAIYRFRGASSAAFEEFQNRFPATRGLTLDENQRSRGNILRVAYAAIAQNPAVPSLGEQVRFKRAPLQSARDLREQQNGFFVFDEQVTVAISQSNEQEAADVADEIEQVRTGARPGEKNTLAVLYRQHIHREKLMEELSARDIPFIVIGMNVMETGPVRDLLALARAVANPGDGEGLFRVCAFVKFGIAGDALREKLASGASQKSLRGVLQTMDSGRVVLEAVKQAREFVQAEKLRAAAALKFLAKDFGLPLEEPALQAVLRFATTWEKKPFLENGGLQEFLDYLKYFDQAGGVIPLYTEEQMDELQREYPDAVQLMSVHAAKGLEFTHVWLMRVSSNSFPASFKETLFEFPAALRGSIAVGEGKEVHEQEERRLFYVAITRARDQLRIGTRAGRGKDKTPPGYMRPLLLDPTLKAVLATRMVSAQPALRESVEISKLESWLRMPPAFDTHELALSANAVQNYSTCPLKFKLLRDWKIPGDAAAAMQYGNAVHTVLKHYYDPAPHSSAMTVDELVAAFKVEFAKALIEDQMQKQMYEDQGDVQLRALASIAPRGSSEVLDTERKINFKLGKLELVGRIDRIDRVDGNAVKVIDYKTGTPKDARFADDSLQLSIYAMGVRQMGLEPRELVLLNLADSAEVKTSRTSKQLETAQQKIEEVAEGIAAGDFEPAPGSHCVWCEFKKLCPVTEQRVFVPVSSLESAAGA
jgi:superfamily I DNA/RNA helicase/RecB family exonuclease